MFLKYLKKYAKWSILISILMLILSVLLIVSPFASIISLILLFGIILIVDGIIQFIDYFKSSNEIRMMSFSLVNGIISILSGILVIITKNALTAFVPILFAVWIIMKSIFSLQISMNLKAISHSSWVLVLVSSILNLLLGLLIILNPFATTKIATITVGIFLAITEVINIVKKIIILVKIK